MIGRAAGGLDLLRALDPAGPLAHRRGGRDDDHAGEQVAVVAGQMQRGRAHHFSGQQHAFMGNRGTPLRH